MRHSFLCFLYGIALLFLTTAAHCQADADRKARTSITHHKGNFHGSSLEYTATVNETLLPGGSENPVASIITTAYTRDHSTQVRPVIFLFNGGPGASSSPLHMEALGPRRVSFDSQSGTFNLIDNAYCLLDVVDMVFIDPVGTGMTKVWDEEKARAYWDVRGDAVAVLSVIRNWLTTNGRQGAPVFLCGQSYGTIRATEMLGLAKDIPIKGVILLSAVLDISATTDAPGNEIPYILFLPTMTAVAWYHHRSLPGKDLKTVYHEAELYAEKEYAQALLKGSTISTAEKENVADRLSGLTGLSKSFILEKNLRVSSRDFQLNLLDDQARRVGQLDGRAVGPINAPNRKPPYNDPSMQQKPSSKDAVATYFEGELRFSGDHGYTTLNLNVNSKWNWNSVPERFGYFTVAPVLAEKLRQDPMLHVLVAGGCYDLATPSFATKFVLNHVNAPERQVRFVDFETGHSIFDEDEQLARLADELRKFINQ